MRLFPPQLLFVLAACSKPAVPAVMPAFAGSACTLETLLDPGAAGAPGHLIASPLNPNGMSQLALLMRTMVADMEATRASISAGTPHQPVASHHHLLRCSWPTQPSQRDAAFDTFAQTYLQRVGEMDASPPDRRAAYARVLQSCRACHETTCEGPLGVIDGLALP